MSTSITKPGQAEWSTVFYQGIHAPYLHSGDRRSEQATVRPRRGSAAVHTVAVTGFISTGRPAQYPEGTPP